VLFRSFVNASEQVAPAWERAFAADRPVVIDAVVDREVPPIPPHVEWKQAKAMMQALLRDPGASDVIRHASKQELLGWLPGRG
jgi:pyruvate dehydrogenase (quinone)